MLCHRVINIDTKKCKLKNPCGNVCRKGLIKHQNFALGLLVGILRIHDLQIVGSTPIALQVGYRWDLVVVQKPSKAKFICLKTTSIKLFW